MTSNFFYSYNDPISGSLLLGLGGALQVLVGAAIRGDNYNHECLVVLVGASILGFVSGGISCFISRKPDDPPSTKVTTAFVDYFFITGAFLLSPLLGDAIFNYDDVTWSNTIIDQLVGAAVILVLPLCCIFTCFTVLEGGSALSNDSDLRNEEVKQRRPLLPKDNTTDQV
jgi:hypothetical protein